MTTPIRLTTLALAVATAIPLAAQAPGPFHITKTFKVGGNGTWDYIVPDVPNHRLFIGRQDRVMVVDERDGKLLGEVTGIHGAHGTAIVPSAGKGFATSGDDSSVVVFDLKTLKPLARLHAAEDADAIIYDEPSNKVFTFNGDAHSSTVIDPVAGKVVKTIDLGGKPEYGVSAGDGKVYVNLVENAEVVEIDAKTLAVARRWSTAPCKRPVAMAIDVAHQRLFSACRSGELIVTDYRGGKYVAMVRIGSGTDGAAYDPATGDVFVSNADGTLNVIHEDTPDTYRAVQTIKTMSASRNMGLDPKTHSVYVAGADFASELVNGGPTRRSKVVDGSFVVMVVERTP